MPLYAITGKMRQGKSYFAVKTIAELNETNTKNIIHNYKVYKDNQALLEKSGDLELIEKFALLETDEQFENYFELYDEYNKFIIEFNEENNEKLNKLKPVRQIYTDIRGLLVPNILPAPDDWRTTPRGSIIFYDEVQDREPYRYNGNVPSKNQMILDIAKIGHTDKDMYLITQDPDNLNKSLRKITDKLYFVKRPPQNFPCCTVYTFPKFLSDPSAAADSLREPKKYISSELIPYKDEIYNLYNSASSHESIKKVIPWKWIRNTVLILIFAIIVISAFIKIPIFSFFGDAISMMWGNTSNMKDALSPQMPKPNQVTSSSSTNGSTDAQQKNLDIECRKGANVEKPECVKWFDDMSKNKGSVTGENAQTTHISYNPNKPFETDQIQNSIVYEVTSKPKFSGCSYFNGKYQAYTQQGTKLDVKRSDCKSILDNAGNRPYDYFADNRNDTNNSVPSQTNGFNQVSSQPSVQRHEYVANNVVEPNLQPKTIDNTL